MWTGLVLAVAALAGPALGATPAAPGAVEASADGGTIRIYWEGVTGADQYAILRDGSVLDVVDVPAVVYVDRSPVVGRNHTYAVQALSGREAGAVSRPYIERADAPLPASLECDLMVVGATTAGVAAAVVGARYGLDVVLIEETGRLGGMSVNGLGASDIRRVSHASGFFEEFRRGVAAYYGTGDGLRYEPRVAHQVMKELVWSAPGLRVFRRTRPVGVRCTAGRIEEVRVEHTVTGRGCVVRARLVVDATECGDVAAWAGAPYRVGREARSAREPHAGHIYYDRARDRVMPNSTGASDRRVQAYAYLMTVKDYGAGADRTIPPPDGYDRAKYDGAPAWERSWNATSGKLPNGKFEINQHPYGSDLQGVNYDYPTADYATRRKIEEQYRLHALGYLHYIQTVQGMRQLGLTEDDFRADGGWPSLLYVREARRFEADVVMHEDDIMSARSFARPDAIGIGDYAMDSHATQPKPDRSTPDMGEGEFYLPQYTPWHQIPYRIIVPRAVRNLFVVTAVSATHVAYGTYRMEPVRMHFGSAAGIAAHLCLRFGLEPRNVPVRQVQAELLKRSPGTLAAPARSGSGAPGACASPTLLYMFDDMDWGRHGIEAVQWLAARGFFPCPKPAQRSPALMLSAQPFRPDDPITWGEAARVVGILAARAAAVGDAVSVPDVAASADKPMNRAEVAAMLAAAMGWSPQEGGRAYADLSPDDAPWRGAQALADRGIDVQVWGVLGTRDPAGELRFAPDAIVSRIQFAQWVRLAHWFVGPLFDEHPMDTTPTIPVRLR